MTATACPGPPPNPLPQGEGGLIESPPSPCGRGLGGGCGPTLLAAALLTWPALLNGYPLVFSDTGTYLSQALNHYLGWDRPVFYSFFLLPLHMGLTLWPVVAAQALLAAWVLGVVARVMLPGVSVWCLPGIAALLAIASPLPWIACQLMPDLFTGLMILAVALLILAPERMRRLEALALAGLAAFAMAAHLSNLPLALGLIAVLLPLRRRLGAGAPLGIAGTARVLGPPLAASAALALVNLIGHGTLSLAPYGKTFLLARVIYDGPGRDALVRSCPRAGWRLCAGRDRLPGDSDLFLWSPNSPLNAPHKNPRLENAEAGAIIWSAIRAEPGRELTALARNTARQLVLFGSGDGLNPWPATVTPWINRDFPSFEQAAYSASRQNNSRMLLPGWLGRLHIAAGIAGLVTSFAVLPGLLRRGDVLGGVLVAILAGVLGNAFVTGALSGPHDRYQNRVMWLPILIVPVVAGRRVARQT